MRALYGDECVDIGTVRRWSVCTCNEENSDATQPVLQRMDRKAVYCNWYGNQVDELI